MHVVRLHVFLLAVMEHFIDAFCWIVILEIGILLNVNILNCILRNGINFNTSAYVILQNVIMLLNVILLNVVLHVWSDESHCVLCAFCSVESNKAKLIVLNAFSQNVIYKNGNHQINHFTKCQSTKCHSAESPSFLPNAIWEHPILLNVIRLIVDWLNIIKII